MLISNTLSLLGINEVLPHGGPKSMIGKLICEYFDWFCSIQDYIFADKNSEIEEESRLLVYLGHFPAGSSWRSISHFLQIIKAK